MSEPKKNPQGKKTKQKEVVGEQPKAGKAKGKNKEGLQVGKQEDFSEWYTQTIIKSELISYYDISGCYILRPWAFSIWERIQGYFDGEIKRLGVQNAYFPLLVSERALETEKKHIEDFAPEVAWVTRSGKDKTLNPPVAIRPTSETIMYPAFATWIRSHRDLPLRLNQWSNVIRWEFKHPVPFLRSREFLWQEGHSAFAAKEEADKEVFCILDRYASVYEDLLSVPVIKGTKSENEKFPGADYTTTVEGFIPANGRGIQGATSHSLGQNFSKMFNIAFEGENKEKAFVWQNSWGLTTRAIGVLIMVHGDDLGLVLPPRVAPVQVVIIPLHFKDKDPTLVDNKAEELIQLLQKANVRVHLDNRTHLNPGNKYNYWDLKGVPLKIELGPRDVEANQVVISRRDTLEKATHSLDGLVEKVTQLLETIQKDMLQRARKVRDEHIVKVTKWEDFVPTLDAGNLALVPWCNEVESENDIKEQSGLESKQRAAAGQNKEDEEQGFKLTGSAKCLCIPHDQPELPEGTLCFRTGKPAKVWALFGRSY